MPIYEFSCQQCGHNFEALVKVGATASCPACQADRVERRISLPAVKSESTHALALKAAKRRDQRKGRERVHEQIEYERKHHDD